MTAVAAWHSSPALIMQPYVENFVTFSIFILPRLQPLPDQATIMSELNRITLAVITFRKIKQTAAQINTI